MKEVINEYNVVPLPVTMNEQPGRFYLNSDVPVVVNASQEVKNIASSLSTTVLDVAGIKLKPGGELHENVPTIVFDSIPGMEKEAYKLSVTPQQIKITASTPNGFYYGLQTLYQLLPVAIYSKERARNAEWSVPCVEIEDTPAFRYRGAMLDVCRHFASIDYIKKFIDVLAVHKMNTFHWHLTDDQGWRIEIKKYPKLTEIGSQRSETMVDYFYTHYPFKYDGKPHGGYYTQEEIKELIMNEVIKPCIDEKYLDENTKYFINPSGSFVVGGSWGDSGTTGRKIVCDTYGGRGRIGGGCFSSKDPTKVDRSAAYYSRYVAKNIVANGLARRCEVEVAYAIGKAQPVSLCVDTFGTGKFDDEKLLEIVKKNFNFEVGNIISELDLRKPIYHKTSCYGHFGDPQFTWEKVKKLEY